MLSCAARASGCVGCGYCCIAAPCHLRTPAIDAVLEDATRTGRWPGCPELVYEDSRHWCGLVLRASAEKSGDLRQALAIGGGCSSNMNSWRREPIRDRRRGPE